MYKYRLYVLVKHVINNKDTVKTVPWLQSLLQSVGKTHVCTANNSKHISGTSNLPLDVASQEG